MLTQARLKEVLHYDSSTGFFTWRVKTCRKAIVGDIAGTVRPDGRRIISIDGESYRAHRLVWLYVYGFWPKGQIDHKVGSPDDNWLSNLREATDGQNKQNVRKARRHNKIGLLGVQQAGKKWQARIVVDGKAHYLGVFESPEAAHEAYKKAKRALHPFSTI